LKGGERKEMNRVNKILIISVLLVVLLSAFVIAEPFGASVTPTTPSDRASADGAGNDPNAIAGNITEMDVSGFTVTQSWQGYFGNVTGVITLEDSGGHVMYNWSETSPEGEIFASTNNTVEWNYIQCLNFTADGTYGDDLLNAGGTSLYGTNAAILNIEFGLAQDDPDTVNVTFDFNGTQAQGENLIHNSFVVNSLLFTEGECVATHLFADTQSSEDSAFQEVLMYEPSTHSVVYTTILDEDEFGFDNDPHDFQMIVMENGHETDTSTNTYYFWVELE
jgi:hypothetical protein